jgi:hypothetical protein
MPTHRLASTGTPQVISGNPDNGTAIQNVISSTGLAASNVTDCANEQMANNTRDCTSGSGPSVG